MAISARSKPPPVEGRLALGEALADVGEVRRVAGVAAEEHMGICGEQRVAAPQRGHAIGQRAARPVLHRRQHHRRPRRHAAPATSRVRPPAHANVAHPGLHAERHDEQGRTLRLPVQRQHAVQVEVVVVVVRDQHRVDVRQFAKRQPRRLGALRAQETQRRGALGEDRIGEQVDAADLHQHAGVADPRHRRLHAPHRRARCRR